MHERMGLSPDKIVTAWPGLTLCEVHAALAYYHEHRKRIDADMVAGGRFVLERGTDLAPAPLVEENPFKRESAKCCKRLAENNLSVCGYFSAVFSSQHLSLSGQYFGAGLCGHIV